jgi:uncharacterized protein (DUF362 family)
MLTSSSAPAMTSWHPIALEFVCSVVRQHRTASFADLCDAMAFAATMRLFKNMGYQELAAVGVSFSLLRRQELAALVAEAKRLLHDQDESAR